MRPSKRILILIGTVLFAIGISSLAFGETLAGLLWLTFGFVMVLSETREKL